MNGFAWSITIWLALTQLPQVRPSESGVASGQEPQPESSTVQRRSSTPAPPPTTPGSYSDLIALLRSGHARNLVGGFFVDGFRLHLYLSNSDPEDAARNWIFKQSFRIRSTLYVVAPHKELAWHLAGTLFNTHTAITPGYQLAAGKKGTQREATTIQQREWKENTDARSSQANRNATDDVTIMNARRMAFPVKIDPERQARIAKVHLFVSEDEGRTWIVASSVPASADLIQFTAPADGLYWLTIQVEARDGTREPEKLTRYCVAQKVRIMTAPQGNEPKRTAAELRREIQVLRGRLEKLERQLAELEPGKEKRP